MSVIIDGMDQAKTNIPHFTRERKCGQGLWRLRYDFFPIEYLISQFECNGAYDPLCLQVLIQLVQAYIATRYIVHVKHFTLSILYIMQNSFDWSDQPWLWCVMLYRPLDVAP